MGMNTAMKTVMVLAYTDEIVEASIHDGDPGTTGANEVVGIREDITWNTPVEASGSVHSMSNAISFSIPADTDIHSVGLWNGSGQFRDSLVVNLVYPSAGTYAPILKRRQP